MENEIFKLCEVLIHEDEEFLVPVKKLYMLVKQEKESWETSYEEFLKSLRDNKDFKVIDILDENDTESLCPAEYEEKMQECGFFSGPLVFMAYDELTESEYLNILCYKIKELMHALENIHSLQEASGDQDKASQALSLMKRAQDIEEKITLMKKEHGF